MAALRSAFLGNSIRTGLRMVALSLACLSFCACTSLDAPRRLDSRIVANLDSFDYEDWAAVLHQYVDNAGRVDYRALAKRPDDLESFISLIAAVGPRTRPDLFPGEAQRLAYYINAYNAWALYQSLGRGPLDTLEEHKTTFFQLTSFPLDGSATSLDDLLNAELRGDPGNTGDPRVHFVLCHATLGGPRLAGAPFLAERLDEQLERGTRVFLHEKRNVRLEGHTLFLSVLFEAYAEDFAPSPIQWLQKHATDLSLPADARVRYADYDWRVNNR